MEDRCIKFILVVCALLLLMSFPTSVIALSNPVINEFIPNPERANKEWVELYNPDKIDLVSYYIDDDKSFTDDSGSSLKKSLINLVATDSAYPYIELSRFLNDSNDFAVLFDGTGNIVDEVEYAEDPGVEATIGRAPDGSGDFFVLNESTKGYANSGPKPTPTQIPTSTPDPTNTPRPPTLTKTPTPTKIPISDLKRLSIIPSKNKISTTSKAKFSNKSASKSAGVLGVSSKSAILTPKKEDLVRERINESSSLSYPLIFSIAGAVLFIICAILVAVKIKWRQRQ